MTDSEKLTALKKAYAEIILNTAKEAAARIMVSERKALRYQQELFAAKDEALLMLLRLKQMLDAKVNEAEMRSLNQQKRIDELEAQLGEAEDIVRDLRAELREAQDELEKLTKERMQCMDKQKSENDIAASVEISQENRINNFGSARACVPDAGTDCAAVFDIKSSVMNKTDMGSKCCCTTNCYVCNPDFASIVMRRKEPDLYRNGCTQRIRALERCLLNGNLSLSGQVIDARNEKTRQGEESGHMHTKASMGADMSRQEEKTEELNVMQSDVFQVLPLSSFHRKKKRAARYRKSKAPSTMNIPDQVVAKCAKSDLFCPETFPPAADDNAQSGEDSRIVEHAIQTSRHSPSIPGTSSEQAEAINQSIYVAVENEDVVFAKACDLQNDKSNDELLTNKEELMRKESGTAENLGVTSCKMDLEMVDVSAVNLDVKVSEITEGSSCQPANNKFLMYTFKRKRKRESLSSPDRESPLDDGTSQRNTEDKQNGLLDSDKSTLVTESSRDTRRLAQVARQLISLSERKFR